MSYDISLCDPVTGDTLHLDSAHRMEGGTHVMGGTTECWLNITWNYAKFYYRVFGEKGIRTIYGMTGASSVPVLRAAAENLGDDTDPDYWAATEGNAKRPLFQLIALAEMRPDGVWRGD